MKIGVYFCNCGMGDAGNVSAKVNSEQVKAALSALGETAYFETVNFACAEDAQGSIESQLRERRPDRVVIAACSPRDHEATFRGVLTRAGMNPYLMQLVNIREHVAWVVEDPQRATEKAIACLRAAVKRVALQEALETTELDIRPETLVIGGGPAGLKAALSLAEAGRKVTLVEKGPILGGAPVRYEDVFPRMECGPCMLEPMLGEVLHGEAAHNIELLLLSEVVEVSGFFGAFNVKIRKAPRYVSEQACIGCTECVPACPTSAPNPVNFGLTERKAIDFEFFGGLPNVPFIDAHACVRLAKGEDCTACRDTCPVEGAVQFDEQEQVVERTVGAIVVAVGADLYDLSRIPNLGYGRLPDVYSSYEFERILAANGPTGGEVKTKSGATPARVAIVHCAGSLDDDHAPFCSTVCCQDAFKFNHLISHKAPGAKLVHFYKTIVTPGKEEYRTFTHARDNPEARFVQYDDIKDLGVQPTPDGGMVVEFRKKGAAPENIGVDMVVLMSPLVPSRSARALGEKLELSFDAAGFLEELHGRTDASRSKVRGIFLAGACQAPMDIQRAMTQGMAACGHVLSGLVEGRKLQIEPVTALVDAERCSGCRTCVPVCPYKAIGFDVEKTVAEVNPVLCVGCGTCVAACPAGAVKGRHFTYEQIVAEIDAVLA